MTSAASRAIASLATAAPSGSPSIARLPTAMPKTTSWKSALTHQAHRRPSLVATLRAPPRASSSASASAAIPAVAAASSRDGNG